MIAGPGLAFSGSTFSGAVSIWRLAGCPGTVAESGGRTAGGGAASAWVIASNTGTELMANVLLLRKFSAHVFDPVKSLMPSSGAISLAFLRIVAAVMLCAVWRSCQYKQSQPSKSKLQSAPVNLVTSVILTDMCLLVYFCDTEPDETSFCGKEIADDCRSKDKEGKLLVRDFLL